MCVSKHTEDPLIYTTLNPKTKVLKTEFSGSPKQGLLRKGLPNSLAKASLSICSMYWGYVLGITEHKMEATIVVLGLCTWGSWKENGNY